MAIKGKRGQGRDVRSMGLTGFPGSSRGERTHLQGREDAPRREGYTLQCPCLENPMDGGAWRATVPGVTKSRTRLSDQHFHFHFQSPYIPPFPLLEK